MATFQEIYEAIPKRAQSTSERARFIREIAAVTKRTEFTVRQWLSGRQQPDALTRSVIARRLKVSADELFPEPARKEN